MHREGHIANLIEKQRSPFCHFKASLAVGISTSKSPFLMAKQLTFQQVWGNCTTVNRYKWLILAGGVFVQITGNHFFAGARFASNQNVHILLHHLHHQRPDMTNRTTITNQITEQLGIVMTSQHLPLTTMDTVNLHQMQSIDDLAVTERVFQLTNDLTTQATLQSDPTESAVDENRQLRTVAIELFENIQSTSRAADNNGQTVFRGDIDARFPTASTGQKNFVTKEFENCSQLLPLILVIFNHQNT